MLKLAKKYKKLYLPLLDSVRDMFEGQDQLAKDFTKAFMLTYTKNGNSTVSIKISQKRAIL